MTHSAIGIAGAGELATTLATRLAAAGSGRVIVHGIEVAAGAGGKGARVERAANLFDLASECGVVIAAYDSHAQLREALSGSADRPGLLAAMAPGTLLLDLSQGAPEETRRLAGALSPRAIGLVECGIVGDEETLAAGGAMIYAGGFHDHIERVKPILLALGRVTRIGPQGSGRMYAALTQGVIAAHAVALHEAHNIAAAHGFVPDDLASPPMLDPERRELTRHVEQARRWPETTASLPRCSMRWQQALPRPYTNGVRGT